MTAAQMWDRFSAARGIRAEYEAWSFGDDPDALALLVLSGRKRATSSAYPLYAVEHAPLPQAGEYSVILNSAGEAVCVVRTTGVEVCPFRDITAAQAALEGEGDGSLDHWRRVHAAFFTREMAEAGLTFHREMPVVLEHFQVVYPQPGEPA